MHRSRSVDQLLLCTVPTTYSLHFTGTQGRVEDCLCSVRINKLELDRYLLPLVFARLYYYSTDALVKVQCGECSNFAIADFTICIAVRNRNRNMIFQETFTMQGTRSRCHGIGFESRVPGLSFFSRLVRSECNEEVGKQ